MNSVLLPYNRIDSKEFTPKARSILNYNSPVVCSNLKELTLSLNITNHNYGKTTSHTAIIGDWLILASQDIDKDDSYYSKAWHRKYGSKFTVKNRMIRFFKIGANQYGKFLTKKGEVKLKSWAGNYLANSIVAAGLQPKSVCSTLRIRLHKAFNAKEIKTIRNYQVYSRTLFGVHVDYVIVSPFGTTYHDCNRKNLLRGLFLKIASLKVASSKIASQIDRNLISWSTCKELGFCDVGIKSFCIDFNLNYNDCFSPQQLAKIISTNSHRDLVEPYLPELKLLARIHNFDVSPYF